MVDFKRKLSSERVNRKTEPQELYRTLDRKSVAGALRPAQEYILNEWYQKHHDDKFKRRTMFICLSKYLFGITSM